MYYLNYLIAMGKGRNFISFVGKTKDDDDYYLYPQSLVKQLKVVPRKEEIQFYEFDMQIKINYGNNN